MDPKVHMNTKRLLMFALLLGCLAVVPSLTALAVQQGPVTYITSLAWSPDSSKIAVGYGIESCEGNPNLYTIQILDAVTQQVVQTLAGSTCDITSLDWSPDGTRLAASSLDGIGTRVWDVQSGQLLMEAQTGGQGIASVRWRPPDGLQLADAAVSGGIGILDPATGETESLAPIGGTSLDWSPDGSKLVSGSIYENVVYVADMVAGQQIMALTGPTDAVNSVDWSPDGQKLASGGGLDDPTIWIWDAITGANILTLQGHTTAIREVSWSPDSTKLASASSDGTVRVWDATTGELLDSFTYPDRVYAVDWSPNGTKLAYGGTDGDVVIEPVCIPTPRPASTPAVNPWRRIAPFCRPG
jgi:WD40 repeat protein